MTITNWDEYFIHQTQYPILQPLVDTANWIDRFYWNAHATNGSVMLGVGLGSYRSTGRMDSIVYLLHGKEQRILRLARSTGNDDYATPCIGPLRFEIIEPLRKWRLMLDENESGITWDLTFDARWAPVDYRQFEFDNEEGKGSNYHHYVQFGKSKGVVTIDGQQIDIGGPLLTARDRSWGVRRSREGQGLLLWLQHQFKDVEISMILVETRNGEITYFDGTATTAEGSRKLVGIGHDLRMEAGTRDMLGGSMEVMDSDGKSYKVEYVERLLRGYLGGIGYGGWQGKDRGELFIETDRLDMSRPTADILATQPMHLFGHLMKIRLGDEETVGDLEGGITRSSKYNYRPRALTRV
jgi:hypothetical protein